MIACPNCQASYASTPRFCLKCGVAMPVSLQLGATQPGQPAGRASGLSDRLADTRDGQGSDDDGEAETLIGMVVDDRYRVLEIIGRGGMGAVYKVEHVEMGKVMAMKVLHRDLARERNVLRRFKREAQAISRLTHVNTVSIFDFGRSSAGFMYLVMEYLRGEDLGAILKRDGALGFHRAGPMLIQVCSALVEAHEVGIIHRDLKPENILVARTREGRDFIKVLDFGLAKLREETQGADVTGHGHVVGTPYFMSPEQIRAEPLDHRSDIYSLGALAYRMLTGENPFLASSALGVLTKHLMDQLVPPRVRRPDLAIPEPAEQIIVRAMEKRPQDRFQSADELRKAVEQALAELSSPPHLAESGDALPPPLVTYVNVGAGRRVSDLAAGTGGAAGAVEPPLAAPQAYPVSTREDWDRYERRLKRRRWFQVLGLPLILGGLAAGIWYSVRAPRTFDAQQRLYTADATGVGGREVIPNYRLTGRTHYLRIHEAPVAGKPPTENPTDDYVLKALFRPAVASEELEPNDQPAQAMVVQPGQRITGYLGAPNDVDWFRLKAPASQQARIAVTAIPQVNLRLLIADGAGPHRAVDQAGPGEGERTELTLPASGELLFAITRVDGEAGKQRPTEVPGLSVPYTLSLDLVSGP